MQEKQILARGVEIQKKIGGNDAFFKDNKATIIKKKALKYSTMIWHFFPNISEKCVVIPNFLFGFQ